MFRSLIRYLLIAVAAVIGLVVLFVAWWIAVFAVLALIAYLVWRRFFPRASRPGPMGGSGAAGGPHRTVVIEGQFEVERDAVVEPGVREPGTGDESGAPSRRRVIDDRT